MPQRVVVRDEPKRKTRLEPDVRAAWRWIGWLGVLLTVVGVGDFALAWYPSAFGTPEWEFGTVAASFSGLPLVTMGFAALLGSAVASGRRWLVIGTASVLALSGIGVVALFLLFLTNVPMAVQGAEGVIALGIKKVVVKTSMLGVGFGIGYLVGAYAAFRHAVLSRRG